ncbi:MAG: DMT family transporter, partial [Hyphomicrobiaceae bacterium]
CFAFFQLITRRLANQDRHETTLLYTSIGGTAWASLIVPFFWTTPMTAHLAMFLIIGAMGAGAHFLMLHAFSRAEASLLAPFNYSKLIWVAILGYLVFDDLPGLDTLIGSTIIAVAGLYVLYREGQRLAAERKTPAPGPRPETHAVTKAGRCPMMDEQSAARWCGRRALKYCISLFDADRKSP